MTDHRSDDADPAGYGAAADTTTLLRAVAGGSPAAKDQLLPYVYTELRHIARGYLARERPGHTLQPTALVHEAYLRMIDQTRATPGDRSHFISLAAQMMRRVLINHALARKTEKRGGQAPHESLDGEALTIAVEAAEADQVDLLALDLALQDLEARDPFQARVVELRYFGGLSIEDTAAALDSSPATVKRKWALSKVWLKRRLAAG